MSLFDSGVDEGSLRRQVPFGPTVVAVYFACIFTFVVSAGVTAIFYASDASNATTLGV